MNKDEALKLALKTLDSIWYSRSHDLDGIAETVIAIHAAMQQPEPEPIGWYVYFGNEHEPNYLTLEKPDEPMAVVKPVYTSSPKREPLTDEQIHKCEIECGFPSHRVLTVEEMQAFARAIEAAHNIKG